MIDLLNSAVKNDKNKDYSFYLHGDLCQMSSQRSFLNSHGIVTKQNNVYPCVKECDIQKALTLIWEHRVEGWWHYRDKYVDYGIWTEEDSKKY